MQNEEPLAKVNDHLHSSRFVDEIEIFIELAFCLGKEGSELNDAEQEDCAVAEQSQEQRILKGVETNVLERYVC